MSWWSELRKRWRLRLSLLLLILGVGVLTDEAIKEGYVIDPIDFINPRITHEKIFLALFIAGLLLGLRKRS